MADTDTDIDLDEDVVEHEGVQYHDGDPRPLAALDDDAKDRALAWFWESGIDWECLLQPGYCDHDYYKEMAAERGIEIDEFDWSIGNYNGSDYVTFSGRFDVPKWVRWKMSWYEHLANLHGPHRKRKLRTYGECCWEAHWPDATPSAWLLALETMLANDKDCISARVSMDRYRSMMSIEYEWDLDAFDAVLETGVLAGATGDELIAIVDAADLDKEMKSDCEEIADDACGSLQADYEWHSSMECLEETAEANEWRFDECGNFLHSR